MEPSPPRYAIDRPLLRIGPHRPRHRGARVEHHLRSIYRNDVLMGYWTTSTENQNLPDNESPNR